MNTRFPDAAVEDVLARIVGLCERPTGSHPLHSPLVGWNTLEVLGRSRRVVYHAYIVEGTGTIDVLCLGPRSNAEVYDVAVALRDASLVDDETMTQIWEALALLDVVAEEVGLDAWDYRPEAAPPGMRKAAVAAGVLTDEVAQLLSKKELEKALEHGWSKESGLADPQGALVAALLAKKLSSQPEIEEVPRGRKEPRCGAVMPRAKRACIRQKGHPGPHRAT